MKQIRRLVVVLVVLGLWGALPARSALADGVSGCALTTGALGTAVHDANTCVEEDTSVATFTNNTANSGVHLFTEYGITFTLASPRLVELNLITTGYLQTPVASGGWTVWLYIDGNPAVAKAMPALNAREDVSLPYFASLGAGTHTVQVAAAYFGNSTIYINTDSDAFILSAQAFGTSGPTAISLIRFHAHQAGGTLRATWRVKTEPSIAGFNVYAGHTKLTNRPIAVHTAEKYTFARKWSGSGPYLLQVLRSNGSAVMVPAKSGMQGG